MGKITYPEFRRDDVWDDYHGSKVKDPYRWLEDPDSEDTKNFVKIQTELNGEIPSTLSDALNERLSQLWDYPRCGCPKKHGSRYYTFINSGLQNQNVLYVQNDLDDTPQVFFDPNLLSEDGTTSISTTMFSEDGKCLAYGLSESGSDWVKIKFKLTDTGEDLTDVLDRCKYTAIAWTHDNKGVFYSRYDPNEESPASNVSAHGNQKLYYHRLGTAQSEDVLCVEFPDHPKWRTAAEVSECGRYLIIGVYEDCKNNILYFSDLEALPDGINGKLSLVPIVETFDSVHEYITSKDSVITVRSNKGAPNYCLYNIDLTKPDVENWQTLIPENARDVLEWALCCNDNLLIVCYVHDVKHVLNIYFLENGEKLGELPLSLGTIIGCSGKKKHSEFFYYFTSFFCPGIIYLCDFSRQPFEPRVYKEIKVNGFEPEKFKAEQVFYPSKDGTNVPMYILKPPRLCFPDDTQGRQPCLLYGYGGFNISILPSFNITRIVLLEDYGFYCAIANIRGGGEYGDSWHDAGRLLNKRTSFEDFHHAAKYLVDNGYTSPKRLAIQGASNGGLLVSSCIVSYPSSFGCAVIEVGVMDMLRFHKFTIGHAWVSDYGCSDNKEDFENIIRFSPFHRVLEQKWLNEFPEGFEFPGVLVMTGDHDDRVVPMHSYKFVAALQHILSGEQANPIKLLVDTNTGHGAGKPTTKLIKEQIQIIHFLTSFFGLNGQATEA